MGNLLNFKGLQFTKKMDKDQIEGTWSGSYTDGNWSDCDIKLTFNADATFSLHESSCSSRDDAGTNETWKGDWVINGEKIEFKNQSSWYSEVTMIDCSCLRIFFDTMDKKNIPMNL